MAIPLFLKRKWEKQQLEQQEEDSAEADAEEEDESQQTNEESASNNVSSMGENDGEKPSVWVPQLRLSLDQELTRDQKHELSNRVFTASELEDRILKTTTAMFDIQRQLYRGEEIYFEDTYGHGSIYKGWDGFIDSTSIPGTGGAQMSSNRRVPADSRWFSTSCESVSRAKPPAAFPPPLVSQPALSTEKLTSIAESGTSAKESSQTPANSSNTPTTTPLKTASSTETTQPSSARIRQRMAASAEAAEKGETSAPKSRSRPTTPIDDSGSTKKKRKLASATSSEEPPTKKASQKSSGDEVKRQKTAAGTPKGSKSDREPKSAKAEKKDAASTPGTKSNKSETATPGKRTAKEDAETPAPRKRGRPRRKSL